MLFRKILKIYIFRCWICFACARVAPHSFNFFKMLIDKTEDLDDTLEGLPLDFVDNVHFPSYNEVSVARH